MFDLFDLFSCDCVKATFFEQNFLGLSMGNNRYVLSDETKTPNDMQ